jgi:hypothetical protein
MPLSSSKRATTTTTLSNQWRIITRRHLWGGPYSCWMTSHCEKRHSLPCSQHFSRMKWMMMPTLQRVTTWAVR